LILAVRILPAYCMPVRAMYILRISLVPWGGKRGEWVCFKLFDRQIHMEGTVGEGLVRAKGHLKDEQDAAVPEVALVGVVLGVAQTSEDLEGLAHTHPAALRAKHLHTDRQTDRQLSLCNNSHIFIVKGDILGHQV